MNEDHLETYIEPEIEARIVALVLGEASAFEREELERLIEQKPEVKLFYDRIKDVHEMLDDCADSKEDEDWKLTQDKRDELLATFAGKADSKEEPIVPERKVSRRKNIGIRFLAAAAIITTLAVPVVITFYSLATPENRGFSSYGRPHVAHNDRVEAGRVYRRFDREAEESRFDSPQLPPGSEVIDGIVDNGFPVTPATPSHWGENKQWDSRDGDELFARNFLGGANNLKGFDFREVEVGSRFGDTTVGSSGISFDRKNAKNVDKVGFADANETLKTTIEEGGARKDLGRNAATQWFDSGTETTVANGAIRVEAGRDLDFDVIPDPRGNILDRKPGRYAGRNVVGDRRRSGDSSVDSRKGLEDSVKQIHIDGNNKTRDHVVRRELLFGELGEDDRNGETPDTPSISEKDLLASVTDKPTGTLRFGAGASSIDSVSGFLDVTNQNFEMPEEERKGRSLSVAGKLSEPVRYFGLDITGDIEFERTEVTRQSRKTAASENSKRSTVSSSAFSTLAMPEVSQPVRDDIMDLVPGVVGGGMALGVRRSGESAASDLSDPSPPSVGGNGVTRFFENPIGQKSESVARLAPIYGNINSLAGTESGKAGKKTKVVVSDGVEIKGENRGEIGASNPIDSGGTVVINDEEDSKLSLQAKAGGKLWGTLKEGEDIDMDGYQRSQHEWRKREDGLLAAAEMKPEENRPLVTQLGDTPLITAEFSQPVSKPEPIFLAKETDATNTPFSTFSLHVSDVSFKLAHASLRQDKWPDQSRIRIEEFVNALDYDDPLPSQDERVAASIEQAIHPTMQQRNVLRIALRTAAAGRNSATPLSLTFLLDSSGSMERFDRQETLQRAFSLLAAQLKEHDKVTLISFARQPRLVAETLAGNRCAELVDLVSQLPEEGGTNLEAALRLAFEKAKEHRNEKSQNRIILLTDGAANLGDANPERLSQLVEMMRDSGIAFDAAGIGAEGLNDEILEALTRKGDGRYYLLDRPEDADANFAKQIAGALRPAAGNVKVQVEFNPLRVGKYQLHGFEKHRLNKEDFRNDKVDAAELAAAEAGVALYQVETLPEGQGDIGQVSVRFKDMASGRMIDKRWPIPYQSSLPHLFNASESIRVATVATLVASKLKEEPLGSLSQWDDLAKMIGFLSPETQKRERIGQLNEMIAKAQAISASDSSGNKAK